MKAIKNGKFILTDRILEGKVLLFDQKIIGFVDPEKIPQEAEVIDAEGNYVSPGLIDIHIHGFLGDDTSELKEESIQRMSAGLVKFGVTGWLPTTVTIPRENLEKAADIVRSKMEESKEWKGTQVLGMHAEGPYINVKKKGAQNASYIQEPDAKVVLRNADVIKVITLAPEMDEGYKNIMEIAKNSKVLISMGHTDATYEQALESISCGVGSATHLFNAMTPIGHRAPGVAGAALSTDIFTELIVDTFHVHPALFKMVYNLKKDKLIFITDCLSAGGLADGKYSLGGLDMYLKDDLCRLEDGTIAGSVLTLNKGIRNFCANTDVPLYDVVKCASLNPAAAIGYGETKGSIQVGKDADLFIADKEMNVIKTIIGGTVKYEA